MAGRVEQEAADAEQAVMNFLEQKVALQYQIDLETSLLRIARETQANLEQGEQIRRQEYTERNAAGAEQEPASDALGLPARSAVLRALELRLQGRGEESIARAIEELGRSAPGRAPIDSARDVEQLCAEALRIGASS